MMPLLLRLRLLMLLLQLCGLPPPMLLRLL